MPPAAPDFSIRVSHDGDTSTMVLTGEIDLLTSTEINRKLDALLDRDPPPAHLCLDLSEVGFMDTSGVAVLLKGRRRALEVGASFGVISASPTIERLFEITGLAGLMADSR